MSLICRHSSVCICIFVSFHIVPLFVLYFIWKLWICTKKCKCDSFSSLQIYTVKWKCDSGISVPMVFELHPTFSRSNSKHLPFKFQFGELVLIINCKWEAWVMGLTFPWEPCFLDFHCCYFQRWHLGGASVLLRCHLHAPLCHWYLTSNSISPWSLYFKWKCKSLAICFYICSMSYRLPVWQQHYIYITSLRPPCGLNLQTLSLLYYSLSPIIQVLHLMNKMNLPCPFGPVTARPPMVSLYIIYIYLFDGEGQANSLSSLSMHIS